MTYEDLMRYHLPQARLRAEHAFRRITQTHKP